jgi:hypothetical protein
MNSLSVDPIDCMIGVVAPNVVSIVIPMAIPEIHFESMRTMELRKYLAFLDLEYSG